ncbi:MAG TPA: zinc ribbon domain-containing protein, partial [Saprospiraceae bacterium]|nr:zinc ribbon domain-containing protein [Saprospiraceae bacterium]
MKCPNCHIENPENQKYCGDCGTLLIDTIINDKIFENKIESIIQKQLKDKQVVEIEITENIASKIANWAKLFAYFIGIPFAIIIFILGFLGYNSYSSFTKLIEDNEKKIRPQIELAKVRVDSLNMEAVALKINLEKYKELNKQVSDLTKTVNIIAEKFNIKGVSENKKKQIESSLNSFQDYIKNLGYNPIGKEVNVSIESMSSMGTAFYYDGNSNTMHIDSAYADDYDLFFREYMHRVLYANIDQNNLPSPNEERWYFSIESGLANYYACSHNNNPIFAHTSAKKGNDFKIDF